MTIEEDSMADLLERLEFQEILAHIDACFAGVDTKLASIRGVQALHTTRFSSLERKIDSLERKVEAVSRDLTARIDRLETHTSGIEALVREVLDRLPPRQ